MDIKLVKSYAEHFDWNFEKSYTAQSVYYDDQIEISDNWLVLETIDTVVRDVVKVLVCALLGHKFESCHGNAESGSFYMECSRCGWSHSGYMTG